MQPRLTIEAPPLPPAPEPAGGCPACNGPASSLGALGSREHFRCRNCGLDFSTAHEPSSGFAVDFKIYRV